MYVEHTVILNKKIQWLGLAAFGFGQPWPLGRQGRRMEEGKQGLRSQWLHPEADGVAGRQVLGSAAAQAAAPCRGEKGKGTRPRHRGTAALAAGWCEGVTPCMQLGCS